MEVFAFASEYIAVVDILQVAARLYGSSVKQCAARMERQKERVCAHSFSRHESAGTASVPTPSFA